MYDFIELSDWQSFVISRLSESWQEIHELQKKRCNKLLKEKEEGLITVSGYHDVLAMALGTPEHARKVRGEGGFVKPSVFFNVPRKKREFVSKGMLKQRGALLDETKKMMEEHKKHEAT
ncbi:hypothetical protein L3X38_018473 [Prunus dulcis]|uniref:Uncharacterized protein n=1 Tax=Prunus dulcis TaxID=3755 RepID=A0AAD4ZB13_PRUDU|nr:hypothetical protein L3X38_018473 [Prunus dulcis]